MPLTTTRVRPNVRVTELPTESELLSRSLGCFEQTLSWQERLSIAAETWPVVGLIVVGAGLFVVAVLGR